MTAPKYETAHQISTCQHRAPGRGLHNPVSFRPTFPPCFCFLSRCVYLYVVGEGEESMLILPVIEPLQAFSWKEIIISWLLGKALKATACTSCKHNSGNLQSNRVTSLWPYCTWQFTLRVRQYSSPTENMKIHYHMYQQYCQNGSRWGHLYSLAWGCKRASSIWGFPWDVQACSSQCCPSMLSFISYCSPKMQALFLSPTASLISWFHCHPNLAPSGMLSRLQ